MQVATWNSEHQPGIAELAEHPAVDICNWPLDGFREPGVFLARFTVCAMAMVKWCTCKLTSCLLSDSRLCLSTMDCFAMTCIRWDSRMRLSAILCFALGFRKEHVHLRSSSPACSEPHCDVLHMGCTGMYEPANLVPNKWCRRSWPTPCVKQGLTPASHQNRRARWGKQSKLQAEAQTGQPPKSTNTIGEAITTASRSTNRPATQIDEHDWGSNHNCQPKQKLASHQHGRKL